MKKFLLQCFWFGLPFSASLAVFLAALPLEWHHFLREIQFSGKSIAVVGNSHAQYAVNDTIFAEAVNIANRASPSGFWFAKTKLILEQNPGIRTVIVDIYPTVLISRETDERQSFRRFRGHNPATLMFDLFRSEDMAPFEWSDLVVRAYGGVIIPAFHRILGKDEKSPLQDGWLAVERSQNWVAPRKNVTDGFVPGPDNLVARDYDRLLRLIVDHGAEPVLVTLPSTVSHRRTLNAAQMKYFQDIVNGLRNKYHCAWLDYWELLDADENFCDTFHLCPLGAKRITERLRADIRALSRP